MITALKGSFYFRKMSNPERRNYWPEVPKTEERKKWALIEVGEEMRERLDSMIGDLRSFGTVIVAQKESEITGKSASPFLIRVTSGESDLVLSVSLPRWHETSSVGSVRVDSRKLSSKVRSVELGWQGEKMLGLRVVKGTGDLVQNPHLVVEIRDSLRRLLEAKQAQVEIGLFVLLEPYLGRKTWRTLGERTFSLSSD